MNDAARWAELLGMSNPATPWKDRLPHMIFVSDMGDALSAKGDFPFLKRELVPAFQSDEGKRHLRIDPGRYRRSSVLNHGDKFAHPLGVYHGSPGVPAYL